MAQDGKRRERHCWPLVYPPAKSELPGQLAGQRWLSRKTGCYIKGREGEGPAAVPNFGASWVFKPRPRSTFLQLLGLLAGRILMTKSFSGEGFEQHSPPPPTVRLQRQGAFHGKSQVWKEQRLQAGSMALACASTMPNLWGGESTRGQRRLASGGAGLGPDSCS